jgi:NAD+ diphosphatase
MTQDAALVFGGSPLDREARRRRDPAWVAARLADEDSRFLPLWRLQPLVKTGASRALGFARREFFAELDPAPEPLLLGSRDGVAHFAVDVSAGSIESFGIGDVARFEDLRGVAPLLPVEEAAISAQARSLVDWHLRHRFCAACGEPTRSVHGGAHRVCPDCQAEHFPRTDPVAIAIVVRGSRCLLGRQRAWPAGMYSALAGFVRLPPWSNSAGVNGWMQVAASGVRRMLVVVCRSFCACRHTSSLSLVKVTSHSTMPAPIRAPAV